MKDKQTPVNRDGTTNYRDLPIVDNFKMSCKVTQTRRRKDEFSNSEVPIDRRSPSQDAQRTVSRSLQLLRKRDEEDLKQTGEDRGGLHGNGPSRISRWSVPGQEE